MREPALSIAKFIAGGCAMGAVFGGIVYLGNSGPRRLSLAIAIALIPIAFCVISSIRIGKGIPRSLRDIQSTAADGRDADP